MKANKIPESAPTKWEVIYQDKDYKSIWRYNTEITKFGPVEVEEIHNEPNIKVPKKRGRKPKLKHE
jgi:hypothetical protein